MLDFTEYTKFLIALLAIVNPIGIIPIYISFTAGYNETERVKIAKIVPISATIILLLTALFGELILQFFGISVNSFRVGGGILLLLIAIGMLNNTQSNLQKKQEMLEQSGESIAVVPLSMPLTVGPGAISTVILHVYKGEGMGHYLLSSVDILILGIILWATLKMVPFITRHISMLGIHISTRIMGLILAAISVEFIANGLKGLFPVLN